MGTLFEVNGTSGNITSNRIFGSTQWSKTITNETVTAGSDYNLSLQFTNADKVTGGTTSYDEWPTVYGIDISLTGTSGTANITIDGTDYLATFDTDIATTESNWVTTHKSALKSASNVNINYNPNSQSIRVCGDETILNGITITNLTGDLTGGTANFFTGAGVASVDHFIQPYTGKSYEGQRLQYNIRVNLNIVSSGGSTVDYLDVGLYRFQNDTLIGSAIQVNRNPDTTGSQFVFVSYTADENDPFVDGGFYFKINNPSTNNIVLTGSTGFLIQYYYENPTHF